MIDLKNHEGFIPNEYLNEYLNLLESNKTVHEPFHTEKHHIIPRSYFKLHNLEIDNSSDNLIDLTYGDHILAHYYLSKCTEGELQYKMLSALEMLTNRIQYQSLPELLTYLDELENCRKSFYERRAQKLSAINKARWANYTPEEKKALIEKQRKNASWYYKQGPTEETRRKIGASSLGRRHTEEDKLKIGKATKERMERLKQDPEKWKARNKNISEKRKGMIPTEESKRKNRESHIGKKASDATKQKQSNSHVGLRMYNNGIKNVWAYECPEGFVKGKLKKDKLILVDCIKKEN